MALAELGSFSVEFTRLTQLTGDPKYFDAVQRITDELESSQNTTRIPGLWPVWVNADQLKFDSSDFSLGGCADSAYEYLPKEHILLGAQTDQYRDMYNNAMEAIKENLLFRIMTKDESQKILFTADVWASKGGGMHSVQYVQDHLKCFLGGMVGIGAKVFDREEDMAIARGLTDACIWAYDQMPSGIMPEVMKVSACEEIDDCPWDEDRWYKEVMAKPVSTPEERKKAQEVVELEGIPPGILSLRDPTYKLRFVFNNLARFFWTFTDNETDPRPLNLSSSCTESRATSHSRMQPGVCSRISIRRRAPSTVTLLSRTCALLSQSIAIRWRASGLLKLSSIFISYFPSLITSAWMSMSCKFH